MLRIQKNIIYIFILLSYFGCEDAFQQVVEIEIPPHESKLVNYCILDSNVDTFLVGVYHSQGILEDDFREIEDASIELSVNSMVLDEIFTYDSAAFTKMRYRGWIDSNQMVIIDTLFGGGYSSPMFNLEQNEYTITISANGFPTCEATTIVPPQPVILSANYLEIVDTLNGTNGVVEVEFDNIDPNTFYLIAITQEELNSESQEENGLTARAEDTRFQQKYLSAGALGFPSSILLFDGQDFEKKFKKKFSFSSYENSDFDTQFKFEIKAMSSDVNNFILSLIAYDEAQGNPFAEPVILPTNFDEGYGIFGITKSDKVVFK